MRELTSRPQAGRNPRVEVHHQKAEQEDHTRCRRSQGMRCYHKSRGSDGTAVAGKSAVSPRAGDKPIYG